MTNQVLEVRNLRKEFGKRGGFLQKGSVKVAVSDVSFGIEAGKTLALVGESGSGKSTVGQMILGLLQPTKGEVLFHGASVFGRSRAHPAMNGSEKDGETHIASPVTMPRQELRRKVQVVFQDPYASLNARMTVEETVTEGMIVHRLYQGSSLRRDRAKNLLEQVGLPEDALGRYPHEFSGGQRQRIAIARALSVDPEFLVLDEPTSALDVSVQSQVLNLLRKLQADFGLSYLFITHNLAVVEYLADEVCVMQKGEIVERGTVEQVFDHPQHPYTIGLLNSIPSTDPEHRRLAVALE